MELELRHLRLIVTVAEQGSVTRAATALGLTQPALTAQLNRIDRALGAEVFTRDQRGARPTALGELVVGRAKVLLPAMSALVEDAHRLVAGRGLRPRSVRVGTASTALGGLFVNRLISEFVPDDFVARYIFNNPVRAGLVESPLDYPFLGSDVWPLDQILSWVGECG